jgi:hypothetical protein
MIEMKVLTSIPGIHVMNSDHMPESLWLIIVLLDVLMLIDFKRTKMAI